MKHFKTSYAIVALLVLVLLTESCASKCTRTKRYWSKHRAV
jgi:hypothetical protein